MCEKQEMNYAELCQHDREWVLTTLMEDNDIIPYFKDSTENKLARLEKLFFASPKNRKVNYSRMCDRDCLQCSGNGGCEIQSQAREIETLKQECDHYKWLSDTLIRRLAIADLEKPF